MQNKPAVTLQNHPASIQYSMFIHSLHHWKDNNLFYLYTHVNKSSHLLVGRLYNGTTHKEKGGGLLPSITRIATKNCNMFRTKTWWLNIDKNNAATKAAKESGCSKNHVAAFNSINTLQVLVNSEECEQFICLGCLRIKIYRQPALLSQIINCRLKSI